MFIFVIIEFGGWSSLDYGILFFNFLKSSFVFIVKVIVYIKYFREIIDGNIFFMS